MSIEPYIGRWALTASAAINARVAIRDEEVDPDGVANWLNGDALNVVEAAPPTSGLTLTIAADGTFTETRTGEPTVTWYDAEGVLTNQAEPFDGTLTLDAGRAYLIPNEIPSWGVPLAGSYGPVILRLDDGDTQISDWLTREGERLIRTVNIVTDGMYLDRVALVYLPA